MWPFDFAELAPRKFYLPDKGTESKMGRKAQKSAPTKKVFL